VIAEPKTERPIGDLVSEFTSELSTLVREEMTLARVEIAGKAKQVRRGGMMVGMGAALGYAGLLGLLAALVIGLGQAGVPWWLSALIVALVVLAAAGALVMAGVRAMKPQNLVPRETVRSLREDTRLLKGQAS
jgi:uncharacterized membrane protein YqjE